MTDIADVTQEELDLLADEAAAWLQALEDGAILEDMSHVYAEGQS